MILPSLSPHEVTRQRWHEALQRDGARTQTLDTIDFSPHPQVGVGAGISKLRPKEGALIRRQEGVERAPSRLQQPLPGYEALGKSPDFSELRENCACPTEGDQIYNKEGGLKPFFFLVFDPGASTPELPSLTCVIPTFREVVSTKGQSPDVM